MKKLTLNLQHIEGTQVLTREQLKKVLGGNALVTTGGSCSVSMQCGDGMTISCTGTGNRCYANITCSDGSPGIQCDEDGPLCCSSVEAN